MSSDIGAWHGERNTRGSGGGFFTTPFSSDPWDPWDFGSGATSPHGGGDEDVANLAHANVDWRETEGAHIFRVDLPGVKKEDLKVQVEDGNYLSISGNRIVERVEENDKWHREERRRGSFSRRFRLPENGEGEGIKCAGGQERSSAIL